MRFHLAHVLALLSLTSCANVNATPQTKGFGDIVNFNQGTGFASPPKTIPSETLDDGRFLTPPEKPLISTVDINLSWSEPGGVGRRYRLESGSVLHSGDEFAIRVDAHADRYVYLFHFDSHRQLNELASMSGRSNFIRAGESWELPPAGKAFGLNDKKGTETIHVILSTHPMEGLMAAYRNHLATPQTIAAVGKGIVIKDYTQSVNEGFRRGPYTAACPDVQVSCREEFIIHHK